MIELSSETLELLRREAEKQGITIEHMAEIAILAASKMFSDLGAAYAQMDVQGAESY